MVPPACLRCGTPTEVDAHFCGGCGARIDQPAPSPPIAGPSRADSPGAGLDIHLATTQIDTESPSASAVRAAQAATHGRHPSPFPPPPAFPAPLPFTTPLPPREPLVQAAARAAQAALREREDHKHGGPPLERLIGRTLNGRYLVEGKIGEGGFGAVFRGRQVATGREVALKLLHPHNVSDATVVARFRREAEASSKLRSPHTVTIYDFDETEDGILYLAMELLRGRPLQELEQREGPLEPARALSILAQVAEALREAHSQGVVHRDMKPENVMVETRDGDDFVKVLDFGIAKIAESSGRPVPALTAIGQTLGTLEFMSPEQLRGRPLDGRSDVYALGIMAYEMLTGRLPFSTNRGPSEIIQFHLQTPPPAPSHMRPELKLPREIDEIVLKMVAKEREDRYADALDLRQHAEHAIVVLARSVGRKKLLRTAAVVGGLAALITTLVMLASR